MTCCAVRRMRNWIGQVRAGLFQAVAAKRHHRAVAEHDAQPEQVIGGHAVPEGMHLYLDWHITDPRLTAAEIDRVVDFLGALTDEAFTPATPARVPSGLTPIGQPNRTAALSAHK